MSSIKERIAALNASSSSNTSSTTSPPPPVKKGAGGNAGSGEDDTAAKRKSLSVAERIAMMKAKSEANLLSEPTTGKSENTSINKTSTHASSEKEEEQKESGTDVNKPSGGVERRGSLTIAERIAMMKAGSATQSSSSASTYLSTTQSIKEESTPKTEEKKEVESSKPSPNCSDNNKSEPTKTPNQTSDNIKDSMTIAERIALMKSKSTVTPLDASISPPVTTKKEAANNTKPVHVENNVKQQQEVPSTATATVEENFTSSSVSQKPEGGPERRASLTVAERIALMKANASTEGSKSLDSSVNIQQKTEPKSVENSTPTLEAPKTTSVSDKIAAMKVKNETLSTNQSKSTVGEQEIEEKTQQPPEESPKPKRSSVAERIAAMKAKSEAESKPTPPVMSPEETSARGNRSKSVAEKLALMKQKSIEETSQMDLESPTRPKSMTLHALESDGGDEDDDDILKRPVSIGSRNKLNPKLMQRASMAMPMMMPCMTHPGLGPKSSSAGNIMGGCRGSMTTGSTRVVNEGAESGEITHVRYLHFCVV